MNNWKKLSIEYANQRPYLDDIFHVNPTIPEGIREINEKKWKEIEIAFEKQDSIELITNFAQ
ncbi:type II restriction endonuclease [Flavobacterium branchiophilum NBRC 15030 = ATCC 35035]|uniref:type II restriction endonuclease n=1 Tax=Flavobacterium branchiophilum TaxID=55197 RepID=UPI000B5C0935|nr:type II restriction endonuclease [Flavobacterium branchiophilum NBRC 15030 = ATCC 35035]